MQEQYGLQPFSNCEDLGRPEASMQHRCFRLAVPMAITTQAGCQGDKCILNPRSHPTLRTNMFKKQECASRLEHAPDLVQTTLRVRHRTEDEGHHHAVERGIGERQRFGWGLGELDGDSLLFPLFWVKTNESGLYLASQR